MLKYGQVSFKGGGGREGREGGRKRERERERGRPGREQGCGAVRS